MLENIKYYILFKNIDKFIKNKNYDLALEKLNFLIKEGFRLSETFLKRGKLCKKLLMLEEAYSDFTYIIMHCTDNSKAFYERLLLNFEISNFNEALYDANHVLGLDPDNFDIKRLKFLALLFSSKEGVAYDYVMKLFDNDKYKTIQFLLNETAKCMAEDAPAKALKILEIIDMIDKDNPIKLLNEANIYAQAGEKEKQRELLKKIDSNFPKYFISHFKYTEMYSDRDYMEICFLLDLKIFDQQNLFSYPMSILEGYKNYAEGRIISTKECFERAIEINPNKPDAYVLLAQTFQLMSGYDKQEYIKKAEENYRKALEIYEKEQIPTKAESMKRQIRHLNSAITI